jgi:RNA polymerase sigma-70 factor (ECF subfamily)
VYLGVIVSMVTRDSSALYERAFEEHWDAVFRFLLAFTNDWAAAEDLTQEAFVRLWRSRERIDWSQSVLPWLLVAGRRLATDRFRTLRLRFGRLRVDASSTLDESMRVTWMDVQFGLRRLSGLERTAIVLTVLEGTPTVEVAEILGTTPGAIRAAVSRARDKLEASR